MKKKELKIKIKELESELSYYKTFYQIWQENSNKNGRQALRVINNLFRNSNL